MDVSIYRNAGSTKGNSEVKVQPFPGNPFFKPPRPLSDVTRSNIFNLFKSEPTTWTPRALAEQFGISIVRTEAILRLKALESSEVGYTFLFQGIVVQSNLVTGMENMLNPITIAYVNGKPAIQSENLRENVVEGRNPFTQLLDEETKLTPEVRLALKLGRSADPLSRAMC